MTTGPRNPWLVLAVLGGLAYPLIVYSSFSRIPPLFLVCLGLGLIALRLVGLRRVVRSRTWTAALLTAAAGLILLSMVAPGLAARAYPVLVSLSVAGVFAVSMRHPPTVIERFARMTEPDLPPEGVAYTRKLTVVWIVFLVANAGISAATALCGSLALWTLWNGLLSYLAMGSLFLGELLVRRMVRGRAGT
ncbi:hypothetical protein [Telmatospirillum siberiense]|uniref:DNA gyrase subunit B n=1 Tax=Telmatospirillum siberiense TaxID=382514 RepID=A0A2N3PW24_9PROT|nr:hypothetical protein [Telmatospirillum siberiense]PKU24591.1 hypothetical protein CWS72_10855 [Telmatospirillum siberiense]